MKITITGSLGHISKPLAELLIQSGHQVTIISSNPDKTTQIKKLGADAAIGSVHDTSFLTEAFRAADVIYTMVPPDFSVTDYRAYIKSIGQNYAEAILAAGIKKVVNLSSIGAHLTEGTGPIAGLHDVEQIFGALDGVAIKHLRPAYFYVNFFSNIGMIKNAGILGSNYSAETWQVLVHPEDIAKVAAKEIQQAFTGKSIRYIAGDERKAGEITAILGKAVGKPELSWIEFTDQQAYEGMLQAGLPAEIARNFTEMGAATRSGKLYEDYFLHKPVLSDRKLEDFTPEFALAYNAS